MKLQVTFNVIHMPTSRRMIYRNLFELIFKKTLDFRFKFYCMSYVFIILLLETIFNVLSQVDYEEEASYIAHFSFMC